MFKVSILLSLFSVGALACSSAQAKRISPHGLESQNGLENRVSSPYSIELIGQNGERLDTYHHRGRMYIRGKAGQRYSIRVRNPTASRIEAVLSVDGLDVIDGQSADYRKKRGYIVPAYDNLVVDGFRVSTEAVASFRFSAVANSYAGRKGKAQNVGVIGLAVFREKQQPQMIRPPMEMAPRPVPMKHRFNKRGKASMPPAPHVEMDSNAYGANEAEAVGSMSTGRSQHRPVHTAKSKAMRPRQDRTGLGTAFGEQRHSAVQFTRFVRANSKRPFRVTQVRYNNKRGLRALGIYIPQRPSKEEIAVRERANPFPGMRFAQPPQ